MLNLVPALSVPEQRIWESYVERVTALRTHPRAAEVLGHYHLEPFASGSLDGARLSDLALAIHHLENALEPQRAALPKVSLMEPDDIERHPGFDGVEDEVVAEEQYLLDLRRAISVD